MTQQPIGWRCPDGVGRPSGEGWGIELYDALRPTIIPASTTLTESPEIWSRRRGDLAKGHRVPDPQTLDT